MYPEYSGVVFSCSGLAGIVLTAVTSLHVGVVKAAPLEILAVNYPPYEFEVPQNGLKGFDVEVVEEVFRRMDRLTKVTFVPWARAKKMVFEGGGFALLSCGQRKDRDPFLFYSNPISQGTWGYFYRKNFSGALPEDVEGLRGRSIAVVRGYNQHKELDELGIKNYPVGSDKLSIAFLMKNRVEFSYIPMESAKYQARDMGVSDKIAYKSFNAKDFHLCFSRKWPNAEKLRDDFNIQLAEVKASGLYKQIHDKYR